MKRICLFVIFNIFLLRAFRGAFADFETTINGTRYLISFEKKNWHRAFKTCKQRHMDLISINTPEKYQNALLAIQQGGRTSKPDKYWTSGTDIFSEDNFFWVSNGEAFDYEPWHNHQPDNGKYIEEDCVELKVWNDVYKLNDNNCEAKIYFICSSVDIDVSCQFNLM